MAPFPCEPLSGVCPPRHLRSPPGTRVSHTVAGSRLKASPRSSHKECMTRVPPRPVSKDLMSPARPGRTGVLGRRQTWGTEPLGAKG